MQTYSLDLTCYRCPMPLLIAKQTFINCSKPSQFFLLLNTESYIDIKQLCKNLAIDILDESQNNQQIRMVLKVNR